MKIADTIGLSFLAVTVICTVAALSFLYITAKSNLQRSIEANLTSTAGSRENHIETYLQMLKISVGQLSQDVILENFLKITGKENLQQSKEFEQAMTRLRRTKETNRAIYEFLLLDKTGRVIASSDEGSIGPDKSTDAYFIGGQKEIFIKDVYYLEGINELLMAVSAPFLDTKTGELLGVLVAKVKLNDLWNITMERTGLGKTGEVILVNKHKVMISPSRYLKDTVLKQKVDTEGVQQAFLHKDTRFIPIIFYDYRGVSVLGAHGYIPEMQWVVIAKIDTKEAFAPLVGLRWMLFTILFIMILVVWLLSRGIAKFISGPIKKLHKGTEIIGSGNLDYKVGMDTNDEMGQLSRAFDTMTEKLKTTTTSVGYLNKEIAERKKAEEALREAKAGLEEQVAEKIRELNGKYDDLAQSQTAMLYMVEDLNRQGKELKGAQEKLRKTYLYTRGLIEASLDPLLTISAEGKIADVNKATIKVIGIPKEQLIGTDFAGYFTEPGKAHEGYKQVFDKGFVSDYPLTIRRSDGKLIDVLYNATVYKDNEENVLGVFAAARDVTKLNNLQDKLIRSEKLAVVGQLAASVAHELRNPLGVIKNAVYYLNMLELGKDNPDIKENLGIISAEIENSDKVISDLLEFGRIKQPDFKPEEINLIIKETLNRLTVPAGVKVVKELGENLPPIQADALQMQQVFYNLAVNAIQAMEKGGILTVSSCMTPDKNIAIAFKDTGCGIPKENMQKIFEPLFSTKTKGTGLGLSVVASLVESHGGKIEIESPATALLRQGSGQVGAGAAGKGSIFTVKLPVKQVLSL